MNSKRIEAARQRIEADVTSADIDRAITEHSTGLDEKYVSALRVALKKNLDFISKQVQNIRWYSDRGEDPRLTLFLNKPEPYVGAAYLADLAKLLSDVDGTSVDGKGDWFTTKLNLSRFTVAIYSP